MNVEALKEAIMRRRGKGMDLNIFLNSPEGEMGMDPAMGEPGEMQMEDDADKVTDLAPEMGKDGEEGMGEGMLEAEAPVAEEGDANAPQDMTAIAELLNEYGTSPMRKKMAAMKMK